MEKKGQIKNFISPTKKNPIQKRDEILIRQKTKKRNVKIPNNYLRNESLKSSFNTVVNSSTFKTVISRKVNYAFGNGLFYDEKYKDNLSKYISNLA